MRRALGMQGTFAQNGQPPATLAVDWASALTPAPDEDAQTEFRRKEREAELIRQAHRLRHPTDAAPPPPPAVRRPVPPVQKFRLKGRLFYIIGTAPDQPEASAEARKGLWGHYTVPYYVDGGGLARPYMKDTRYTPVPQLYQGDPGLPRNGARGSDRQPLPNTGFCKYGVDFVSATEDCAYWEVGLSKLKESLEEAEGMDLAFAHRMEGLGNVALAAVWSCLDPDYDPTDRKALMEQFMGKYLDRFWARTDPGNSPAIQAVSEEALHKHKTWCKAWAEKHYKCLSPAVTSPAESLAGEFYPYLQTVFHPKFKPTTLELARIFMRHPELAPEFASCLHYYGTNLELTRGGRNASYKQMSVVATHRATSYAKFGNFLSDKAHLLREISTPLSSEHGFYLHPLIVDWYGVLGQMPYVHRYFEEPVDSWRGARAGSSDGNAPPWLDGRTSRDR